MMESNVSDMRPLLVDTHEAAHLLAVAERTVQYLYQSGELPVVRIGRAVRFSVESLRAWVRKQEAPTTGADLPGEPIQPAADLPSGTPDKGAK